MTRYLKADDVFDEIQYQREVTCDSDKEILDVLSAIESNLSHLTFTSDLTDESWISCEDRLPPLLPDKNCSQDVLILCRCGTCAVACYIKDDEEWWLSSDEKTDYELDKVTHWQPLPGHPICE